MSGGGYTTGALMLVLLGVAIVLRTGKGSGTKGGSHLVAAVRRAVG